MRKKYQEPSLEIYEIEDFLLTLNEGSIEWGLGEDADYENY